MGIAKVLDKVSSFLIDPHKDTRSTGGKAAAWITTIITGALLLGSVQGLAGLWRWKRNPDIKNDTQDKISNLFTRTNPPPGPSAPVFQPAPPPQQPSYDSVAKNIYHNREALCNQVRTENPEMRGDELYQKLIEKIRQEFRTHGYSFSDIHNDPATLELFLGSSILRYSLRRYAETFQRQPILAKHLEYVTADVVSAIDALTIQALALHKQGHYKDFTSALLDLVRAKYHQEGRSLAQVFDNKTALDLLNTRQRLQQVLTLYKHLIQKQNELIPNNAMKVSPAEKVQPIRPHLPESPSYESVGRRIHSIRLDLWNQVKTENPGMKQNDLIEKWADKISEEFQNSGFCFSQIADHPEVLQLFLQDLRPPLYLYAKDKWIQPMLDAHLEYVTQDVVNDINNLALKADAKADPRFELLSLVKDKYLREGRSFTDVYRNEKALALLQTNNRLQQVLTLYIQLIQAEEAQLIQAEEALYIQPPLPASPSYESVGRHIHSIRFDLWNQVRRENPEMKQNDLIEIWADKISEEFKKGGFYFYQITDQPEVLQLFLKDLRAPFYLYAKENRMQPMLDAHLEYVTQVVVVNDIDNLALEADRRSQLSPKGDSRIELLSLVIDKYLREGRSFTDVYRNEKALALLLTNNRLHLTLLLYKELYKDEFPAVEFMTDKEREELAAKERARNQGKKDKMAGIGLLTRVGVKEFAYDKQVLNAELRKIQIRYGKENDPAIMQLKDEAGAIRDLIRDGLVTIYLEEYKGRQR